MPEPTQAQPSSLFFAVWPSQRAADHLEAALAPFQDAGPDWLRWQRPDRWHVTALFLGATTPQRQVDAIAAGQHIAALASPQPLAITGFGRFGSVLWAGVAGAEWLKAVNHALAARLQSRADRERFRAHLTIARARRHRIGADVLVDLGDYAGPQWLPEHLTLVASITGPNPSYQVIQRFPFPTATAS